MSRYAIRLFGYLLILLGGLAGCSRLDPPGQGKPLIVGLPADPVFHQVAPASEGLDGFSRDLANHFAQTLNVDVSFVVAPDLPSLIDMVRKGKVHVAAGIPVLKGESDLRYTQPIHESRQLVVQHVNALPVDTPAKLADQEVLVMPGAPQVHTLRSFGIEPPPRITAAQVADEIAMLEAIESRHYSLVATDELHFAVAANYYPDLAIALDLPEKIAYAWAFHADHQTLRDSAAEMIDAVRQDGTLRRLNDRYFGHIRRLNSLDIQVFLENVRSRLADYRHMFHEAQEITGIDWRLLAALGYQESKWDPLATSPTGVRGLMMLTDDTADYMRVTNRLDARQSILAGSKYLAYLMDELPEAIRQPDRQWFALAAYNIGMGHLGGARQFAPGLKRDPNLWVDMKQVLPLMARPEYYTRLKSGKARGGETVIMVENIRNYYDVLSRFEAAYKPRGLGKEPPRSKKTKAGAKGKPASKTAKKR